MAGRVQSQFVILIVLFFLTATFGFDRSSVLVSYSFDDANLETGPDTFSVFQHSQGTVRLNNIYRLSGYQSIEIRDVAGDRDFPELQGYFKLKESGKLFAHFAILITTPSETLNIALAGPSWFSLQQGGISFWIKTQNGSFYHVSDSIPKKIFPIQSFLWYIFDIAYDVDSGTYDLTIRQEGLSQPLVILENQINAANHKRSAVDKFSFIGDQGEDTSNVVYFIDDVVVGTDRAITQLPIVAPGRRKLFLDLFLEEIRKRSSGSERDSEGRAHFYKLLFAGRASEALQFALSNAYAEQTENQESVFWLEASGDAAFLLKDLVSARKYYEESLARDEQCKCIPPAGKYLKLSDLYFLAGDLTSERAFRERIYGSLFSAKQK